MTTDKEEKCIVHMARKVGSNGFLDSFKENIDQLMRATGRHRGFPGGKWWRIHLPMQEMQESQVRSLGQEDPLEKEMATHSGSLAWKIPWKSVWWAIVCGVTKSQIWLSDWTQAQAQRNIN